MVVCDLDFKGISFDPLETDAPLIVDADTVLSSPVTSQYLEPVSWWNPQILQVDRILKKTEFASCKLEELARKALDTLPLPYGLGSSILEALYHDVM